MCGISCTFASSNSGMYRPFALVVRSFWSRCWFDYWNEGVTGKPAGYNLPFHNNETKDLGNGLKQKLWVFYLELTQKCVEVSASTLSSS